MKGTLSFHPVSIAFFDEIVAPLVADRKINPDRFLAQALALRLGSWVARRFPRALERVLEVGGPPLPDAGAGIWQKARARLERFDWRPDEITRRVAKVFEPDLHLYGRPFFIAESAAAKAAEVVDRYLEAQGPPAVEAIAREQLGRLDEGLAGTIAPADVAEPGSDLVYRNDLLAEMTLIRDLALFARQARPWERGEWRGKAAAELLPLQLPWHAAWLHSRGAPFWIARDVDGLETICRSAGIPAPPCLVPAWRLFAEACEAFPALRGALRTEAERPRDLGGYVAPSDVPDLVSFLADHGARIIQAATRYGEGPRCSVLLRKIRECVTYAERHGLGYLEASGILPPDEEDAAA